MDAQTRVLDAEILSFMRRYPGNRAPDGAFNALALKIFCYQFERNRFYRRWAESMNKNPSTVCHWKEISAVPALAFKHSKLISFPAKRIQRVFRTSGTTASSRGRHYFETLKLYETAILGPFRRHALGTGARLSFHFLMPSPQEAPESSLSHMMGVVNRNFAGGRGRFYVHRGHPDYAGLEKALSRTRQGVFLLTTAFALKGFLEHLEKRDICLRLPAGSRLFETGGFKGRTREISKHELYALSRKRLGIPLSRIVSEYGMTELSSQYYNGTPPAWMRAVVVDPQSGKEVRRGAVGVLRHVDLANRGSVLAIETEDLGRLRVNGRIELLGRAQGAALRGCSLAYEDFLKQ